MKSYRIYTEDLNREKVTHIMSAHFSGFTIIPAIGYWNGAEEKSLVIEVLAEAEAIDLIEDCVRFIKLANNQDAVLVTIADVDAKFVKLLF